MSEIKVGVREGSRYLECQESWCGVDRRYISRFLLLELEGPYVIADKGFDTSTGDEDQGCAVVARGGANGDVEFAGSSVFPFT